MHGLKCPQKRGKLYPLYPDQSVDTRSGTRLPSMTEVLAFRLEHIRV